MASPADSCQLQQFGSSRGTSQSDSEISDDEFQPSSPEGANGDAVLTPICLTGTANTEV